MKGNRSNPFSEGSQGGKRRRNRLPVGPNHGFQPSVVVIGKVFMAAGKKGVVVKEGFVDEIVRRGGNGSVP